MQSVVEPLDEVGVTAAVNRQALGHPFVHTADGRLVLAPLGTGTDDFLEGLARHQQVGRGLIVVAVLLVAEGQTVVLIVDDEGLADGFDGRAQHGLAGLQLLLDDRPGDEGAVQHQQQHNDDQGAASTAELKQMWRDLFHLEPPPFNRRFLETRLAYRIQELAYGGLKRETAKRLEQLGEQLDGGKLDIRRRRLDNRPIAGTRLIREWQGSSCEVLVCVDHFDYQGRRYKSLSSIARAITGTNRNGWAFFGLGSARSA